MSLKNIWRLRFFINRYSSSDKKKRYMNNKLEQLEEDFNKVDKENETMKTILLDALKKHGDLCSLCEAKGQKLPECKCMKDNECLEHIIDLYGGK